MKKKKQYLKPKIYKKSGFCIEKEGEFFNWNVHLTEEDLAWIRAADMDYDDDEFNNWD